MLQAFYSLFYSATKPFRSRYLYTGRPIGAIEHRSSLLLQISYISIKLLLVFIWMRPEMVRTVSDYSAKLDMNARPKKEYKKSVFLLPHRSTKMELRVDQRLTLSVYSVQCIQPIIAILF